MFQYRKVKEGLPASVLPLLNMGWSRLWAVSRTDQGCRVRTWVLSKSKAITDVATPKPPFECATFWVESRQLFECALPVYSEQHLGTFGRNPKEVQEVGLSRSRLYPP